MQAAKKLAGEPGARHKGAVFANTWVYNTLESMCIAQMLDAAKRLADCWVSQGAPLSTEWRPDLLGGVLVIKGQFADGKPLLAIPNDARLNRGGRSIVWMKDQ